VGARKQPVEVLEGAVVGVDVEIIGAEVTDLFQPGSDAWQVADPVVVGVGEA
jgi:hypothetical protein